MVVLTGVGRFDGAQVFNRVMIWVCLSLSVITAGYMLAITTAWAIFTLHVAPCAKHDLGEPPAQVSVACHSSTTTVTTVRTVTRTVTENAAPQFSPADLSLLLLMTPTVLLAIALWQAAGFFRQLFKGRAFNAVTVRRLRNFSIPGVLYLVLQPNIQRISVAVLKPFHVDPGTITWGPSDIFGWKATVSDLMLIVFAAVLIAMVSVLARAAALAEDHAQIV